MGSTTTNHHGVAAFNFATVSGCDQLVVGPPHAHGGTLDLLMNDVPDLVRVAVVGSIGNSDHFLSAVISMVQVVKTCVLVIQSMVQYRICPLITFALLTILLRFLNEHLSLLVGRYVPTTVIHVRNKDKPWFDDQCRHAFGLKQDSHLRWNRDHSRINWDEFVHCQVTADETYSEAKHQFSERN